MNKDNLFIKLLNDVNEGLFGNSDQRSISEIVSNILSTRYDLDTECTCVYKNIRGNLDICFIFGKVKAKNPKLIDDTTDYMDMIQVDDNTGTRIISVIFVNTLFGYIKRLKRTDTYTHIYKIEDTNRNLVGYATDYHKDKKGNIVVYKKDYDREVATDKNRVLKEPSNCAYIAKLYLIFASIIDLVKPQILLDSMLEDLYFKAPFMLAEYSHKLTIGPLTEGDSSRYELINNHNIVELLEKYIYLN